MMSRYTIDDLLQLMAALRDPETGCPWDRKQNLKSLVPFTLEEAYEVAAAIDHEDPEALSQELGDLLFQVVFYAQLSAEQGHFEYLEPVYQGNTVCPAGQAIEIPHLPEKSTDQSCQRC